MLVLQSPPDASSQELTDLYRRRAEEGLIMHGPVEHAEFPLYPEFREEWQALTIVAVKNGFEEYRFADKTIRVDSSHWMILGEDSRYAYKLHADGIAFPLSVTFPAWMPDRAAADLARSDNELLDYQDGDSISFSSGLTESLFAHDDVVSPHLEALGRACLSGETDHDWYEQRLQLLMQTLLIRQSSFQERISSLPARKASTRDELVRRIGLACNFINERYMDPGLSVSVLAETACMSQFHFLRTFRALHGHTPFEYLQRVRCDIARHLLRNSVNDIETIAQQSGFRSRVSMFRRLKQIFGQSPSELRACR